MIASDWLYDQGKWYYLSTSGSMKASAWVYDKGEWYYVSSSGAMLANDWVKDNGKWYYLASSGKMLRDTYTPDGYYVDKLRCLAIRIILFENLFKPGQLHPQPQRLF